MDMAPKSNEIDNTVKQLQRELRLRTPEDAGNLSSGCSSPATSSGLVQKLQTVLHQQPRKASSPRTPESRKKGRFQTPSTSKLSPLVAGVSPSCTASSNSDSSSCGATVGSGCFSPDSNSKEAERNFPGLGSQDLSLTVAPPGYTKGGAYSSQMDSKHCIGDVKDSPAGNVTSGEGQLMKPDPGTLVGGANKGAGGCAAGVETPAPVPAPPPKRKRKRKSKKPPTEIVEATQAEFLAKVQELTGMKTQTTNVRDNNLSDAVVRHPSGHSAPCVEVLRPQAKRPQIGVCIPSAAGSSTALIDLSSVSEPLLSTGGKLSFPQAPGPAVYQAPPHIASHPAPADASCSSHSDLNGTFGYHNETSEMERILLLAVQEDDLKDIDLAAASKSQEPCDYVKASDTGINISMHSPYGPPVPQADSLSYPGYNYMALFCDSYLTNDFPTPSERMEDADGEQDEETKKVVDQWIVPVPELVPYVSR